MIIFITIVIIMNWEIISILNDDMKTEINHVDNSILSHHDNSLALNKIINLDEQFANTLCRLCACSTMDPISIYSELGESLKLAEKINSFFGIKIQNTDPLPKQICKSCIDKINCNNAFEIQCIQAGKALSTILEKNKSNIPKSTCDNEYSLCLDGEMITIIDDNLEKTYQHDMNIMSNNGECILDDFHSENSTCQLEREFIAFECLENDEQYLKCNACMNLFCSKISMDNHKCKPLPHLNMSSQHYKCSMCELTFSFEERLNFHRQLHLNANSLNCNICNIDFNQEQKLFHHYKRYHCKSTAVSCLQCGKLFDNQSQLRAHMCIDGKIRHRICEVCNKGFTDGYTLKRHVVTHLPEKPFKCNQCSKSFTQKSRLNKHIAGHGIIIEESQICWKCLECGEIFPSCEEADDHYKCHDNVIILIEQLSVTKIYHCEFCNIFFADFQNLKIHQSKHLAEKSFACTICKIEFKSFNEAVIHWRDHPRIFKLLTVFVCDICEKDTKELALLYKHKRKLQHFTAKNSAIIKQKMLYTCELCGNVFDKLDDIIGHSKSACSKFPCEICGSVLPTANSLEAHKRRHKGLRPYVCNICGKSYTQSSHMWTHKRFHMGVKPYACEYCDQKFTIKPDLADHTRKKHTRERPFKCEICNKAFLTGSVFYQHRLIHRGDRRYKCNYCQKSFTRTEALNNHVKIHTGEKPHACNICGRCFRQKGDMRKHRRTQHNVKDEELILDEQNVGCLEEVAEIC